MGDAFTETCGISLWRNVIRRALEEAEGKVTVELTWRERKLPMEDQRELRANYMLVLREDAKDWLTIDSQDLRIAFHLAQLPGTYAAFVGTMRARLGFVVN